jgi:maltose/moltooligosaccharide transporter
MRPVKWETFSATGMGTLFGTGAGVTRHTIPAALGARGREPFLKLNYKRTALIGLAFLSICAFWGLYEAVVPLMLRDTFHLGDTVSGAIMALDNVLALFMLPLFGTLSDKTHTRIGRRMPYILAGTAAAAVLIVLLPLANRAASLPMFFASLGLLLLAMGTYRAPAVALMPDLTPKPLRSKANAVINLMGALGTVLALGMIAVMAPAGAHPDYLPVFLCMGAVMALCVLVLFLTVKENKLAAQMPAQETSREETQAEGGAGLDAGKRRSLALILCSVALWFMGYNAVSSAFTKYATSVWGHDVGQASTCLMVATVSAVISYLPIGALSSRWGRKKTILLGVTVLSGCFALAALVGRSFSPWLYGLFMLVGFAWAAINVNSYPMVVEIGRGADVGKYTGYYYTFSMAAQIITPVLSGFFLERFGYWTLFPYAALAVALAFVTMSLTRHGDSRPQPAASKLEAFDTPD